MKYRKLRIAWTVTWGIACLLLIALWVRSYSRWDRLSGTSFGKNFGISSIRGTINGSYYVTDIAIPWNWYSNTNLRVTDDSYGPLGFGWYSGPLGFLIYAQSISLPHWFFAMLFLTLGTAAWLPWRFSLRTLLITMTVVAVGLGAIVISMR